METIVQIILLRKDLIKKFKYSKGALIAQCCHASTAAIVNNLTDISTKEYIDDLKNMHKIILSVEDDNMLNEYASKLEENKIIHYLWTEQPENIQTCLALKPYPRHHVNPLFTKLKLFS